MVTCAKCGTNNPDGADYCSKCGAMLYSERRMRRREGDCFGAEEPERECFGLPYGGAIAGIILGLFIVIIGLAIYAGQDVGRYILPFVLIVIGALVLGGALYRYSRSTRRR